MANTPEYDGEFIGNGQSAPSPSEIRAMCLKIQEGWDEYQERARRKYNAAEEAVNCHEVRTNTLGYMIADMAEPETF